METTSLAPAPEALPAAPATEASACATCHAPLVGTYCHACGEKRLHRHDYALKHFLEHAVDTVTHFDLRVLRDLGNQIRRPGFLAAEWLQGRRVRHAPPVQLFLITNLVFYVLAGLSGFSPFETKLQYHFSSGNGYGGWAYRTVEQHLAHTGLSLAAFAEKFNALAHGYSKSLVFVFVPLLAGPLWLLFWRQRRYFVEWLTLSTYLFGGVLLIFAGMALLSWASKLFRLAGQVLITDTALTTIMFLLTSTYAALFYRRAFPGTGLAARIAKGLLYTTAFTLALVVPYRFVLFAVVYWAAR
jgi:hypothetical protein